MNLNIRLACSEDMEQILEVQRQAIQMLCSKDYNPIQVNAIIKSQHQWRGPYECIYVAEQGDVLIGFIAFSACTTKILGIYVHPDYTRQGIATQLLQYFEHLAIARKRHTLEVISSLTAVALYQSQGYVAVRKTTINALGASVPCLYMEKSARVPLPRSPLGVPTEVLWGLVGACLVLRVFR